MAPGWLVGDDVLAEVWNEPPSVGMLLSQAQASIIKPRRNNFSRLLSQPLPSPQHSGQRLQRPHGHFELLDNPHYGHLGDSQLARRSQSMGEPLAQAPPPPQSPSTPSEHDDLMMPAPQVAAAATALKSFMGDFGPQEPAAAAAAVAAALPLGGLPPLMQAMHARMGKTAAGPASSDSGGSYGGVVAHEATKLRSREAQRKVRQRQKVRRC